MTRTLDLETFRLGSGGHQNLADGACLLEATAYIAGERWTDHPQCVSPVLTSYGISLNDRLGDEDRQKLKAFIPGMIGTAGDGKDYARRFLAADWAIRVATPRWLDAAGMTDRAATLRELAPVTSAATLRAAQDAARDARDEAWAARRKARTALEERVTAELKKRGVAVADAVTAAAAVAVTAADAAADAAAVADADAVAAAVAAKGSTDWYAIYRAVRGKLDPIYRAKLEGSKFAEVRDLTNQEAIELLGRMIDPEAPRG